MKIREKLIIYLVVSLIIIGGICLIFWPPQCRAGDLIIYDQDWRVRAMVQDGIVYDKDWRAKWRIENRKIYDSDWRIRYRIEGSQDQNEKEKKK